MTDSLANWKPLGFYSEWGRFLYDHDEEGNIVGSHEATIEEFNEVMGGDLGNGWTLTFEEGSVDDE